VSAVLDIGISFANSGDNLSVSVVSAEAGVDGPCRRHRRHRRHLPLLGEAIIRTGDAVAVGKPGPRERVPSTDHDPACGPSAVVPP